MYRCWATGRKYDFYLELDHPLFSKARPRMTRSGHTYMPAVYKEAQAAIRVQLRDQWGSRPLIEGPVALHLEVWGEGRGDTDNIAGAFMDSAQGIVFADDRVTVIKALSIQWHKARKQESKWHIYITNYELGKLD
jgi:Holliday junction resolvase RusA-like endonuclease